MAITLATYSTPVTTVTLPDDLVWVDEFQWSPIVQQADSAIDGSLILQESTLLAGRPITLVGGQNYAWASRTTVLALKALADAATDTDYLLTLNDGSTYRVRFRRSSPSQALTGGSSGSNNALPFTATPVVPYADPADADNYVITINLFVVPAP